MRLRDGRPVPPRHRVGPKMREAVLVVAAFPGCTKLTVADSVGPHGSHQFGYRTVDRAIAAGLLDANLTSKGYQVTLTQAGRQLVQDLGIEVHEGLLHPCRTHGQVVDFNCDECLGNFCRECGEQLASRTSLPCHDTCNDCLNKIEEREAAGAR
jgi:hypothetical protein